MAKVAVLVPNQELCTIAQPLVHEFPSLTLITVEHVKTNQVEARAHELEQQGCELIIARGVQARIIKRSVKLPLVEICVTQQELAHVILELKKELNLPCPKIGLIGISNMFSNTSEFNDLFGINLTLYMTEQDSELADAVAHAITEGCQAVIGGDIVCECAQRNGLPYRFISSGVESLRNALAIATRIAYAIDLEKRNSAEINALLNYTFSGIIQIDSDGIIRRVNRISYNLLERPTTAIIGKNITDVLPNLNQDLLDNALLRGEEAYAFLLDINHKAVVVNIAPILVDVEIEGAVLTFQEGRRLIEMDSELRRELYQRGFIAKYSFDTFICKDPETRSMVELAKRISKVFPLPFS